MNCPCGTGRELEACCGPVISGERAAVTAEELMRARYTAYTKVAMDFLQSSVHPDFRQEEDPEGARDWAENSEWHGLEVVEARAGGPDDETGRVEFVASYTYEGQEKHYHEVAEFQRFERAWMFTQGRPGVRKPVVRDEPRISRNDPCHCGSGKKYKRCCGG